MKEFFDRLNALARPGRADVIEKDYYIHRLLSAISRDNYLSENLVFKGGTCLIKAYLGHYRFSEDIDFTWRSPGIWKGRSKTETVMLCSQEITQLAQHFKVISQRLEMKFSGEKNDRNEAHISSSGRMVQFYIGYMSEMLRARSRIKVEINFVEDILYPYRVNELKNYADGFGPSESRELSFLYGQDWRDYTAPVELTCYDPREIFSEKCRAAMTRKAYKFRDILDIYFMERGFGYSIPAMDEDIKRKVRFMMNLYRRYQENLELTEFPSVDLLKTEEMKLMLVEPPAGLKWEILRIHGELTKLRSELL